MFNILLFFLFLVQSEVPALSTSQDNYLVRHFTAEDGLPVNAVSDIAQDDLGYIYFATLNGLARFDGYEFVTFNSNNSDGILTDRFSGMKMTSNGDIWLPTESGFITRYHKNRFRTYTDRDGVDGQVYSLEEDNNGFLWLATSTGLKVFDPETDWFQSPHPSLQSGTRAIEPIQNGGLLAVNESGLIQFNEGNIEVLLEPDRFPFSIDRVMELKILSNGTIWVLGADDFFVLDKDNNIIYSSENIVPPGFLSWNVYETDSGIILSTSQGFYQVDAENYTLSRFPIKTDSKINRPNTVVTNRDGLVLFGDEIAINNRVIFETEAVKTGLVDREGSIWVTSERNGIFQLRKGIITNITSREGRTIENIYPIIQAVNGDIWAGSLLTGVIRIREEGTDFWNVQNSSLISNLSRFLYQDGDSTLYLGLWSDGLWRFEDDDWTRIRAFDTLFTDQSPTVEAMLRSADGTMIIGTRSQTVVEREGRYHRMEDALGVGLEGVRVIRQSENGSLFFGTGGQGIGILTPNGDLTTVTEPDGMPSNFIRDIYIQSPDTVWVATENRGLARVLLNGDQSVRTIGSVRMDDGLMDNSLHRIIDDDHANFWISSNSGVMKLSRSEVNGYLDGNLERLPVISYNQRDGMVNPEANGGVQTAGVLTNHNEIWFPNQKGITVFDLREPDSVERSGLIHPLIQHLTLRDSTHQISNDETILLPVGQRNVTVTFTAPNFAYPERVSFRYRLSGINDDWITASRYREAIFTNLNPGTHRFDLQAGTGDGANSSASIFITVPSYFYETYWFYLLMALSGGLLIFGGFKYRTSKLVLREIELQKRVDEQTDELKKAAEQKSRFFSGITHELRTPLSLILGPLGDLTEAEKPIDRKNIQNQLQMMQRNGYRLQNLVDQILDVTKLNAEAIRLTLQPVDLGQLSKQIAGQFQSRLAQEKINLEVDAEKMDSLIYVDLEAWERIIINLMSNAIKFSPVDSAIHIAIKYFKNEVRLSVKDEGRGIKPEDQQRVFDYLYQAEGAGAAEGTGIGLYLVKGLVEQMGGTIELISAEGEGAEFIVTLKKGYTHFLESDTVVHKPLEKEGFQRKYHFTVNETAENGSSENESADPDENPSVAERILVVEDNDDFRSYLKSILSETYSVMTASDGEEAFELLTADTPDLIISDVMMPGMNGLEFVNSLRQKEHLTHLPVIFLSARNQESDRETGLSSGADIYLTKPIRSKMLFAQIEAVLRRERVLSSEMSVRRTKNEPELMYQVRKIVYRQLANPSLSVDLLADALYISRTKLYGDWKKVSDFSLNDYIKKLRLDEGRVLILEKGFSILEASKAVGFSNVSYFSTSFKKEFGVSPSKVTRI